ncbi:MAG: phosphoribosylformylglycinamidine cyclo-ligase, partial [Candidatus Krumholzibacteria bacterium]|nr:phosphoribosylformylglycinamidine cyclo-ligase [Candidatus Krumholzibacteria bacterium]
SGVDIDRASSALKGAGSSIRNTWNQRVLSGVGAFGGLYDLQGLEENVLVSSVDGVGTKLKLAFQTGRHDTVGQCLVNHCVNDILVQGARPLFFLDYFATGQLEEGVLEAVIGGMAKACEENSCALIAGETAEMPGFYPAGEYDLAGCIVGAVARESLVDGSRIRPGDLLLGMSSTGLHTNGYSLARKVLLDEGGLSPDDSHDEGSLADALLAIHRSYLPHFQILRDYCEVRGMVHLTGGGFVDNIPRILPEGLSVRIHRDRWEIPSIFRRIAECGNVSDEEMHRVFNMGVGFLFVLSPEDSERVLDLDIPDSLGVLGEVMEGSGEVHLD